MIINSEKFGVYDKLYKDIEFSQGEKDYLKGKPFIGGLSWGNYKTKEVYLWKKEDDWYLGVETYPYVYYIFDGFDEVKEFFKR